MLRTFLSRQLLLNSKHKNLLDKQFVKNKGSLADFYGTQTIWKGEQDYQPKFDVKESDSAFEGYIPTDKIDFKFSRSGGPGGQHVNKINTKVEARFHVESADWLSARVKQRLTENEQSNINKDGYLILKSEKTRKQTMNQADVLSKLRRMLFEANVEPREVTEEDQQILSERENRAKEANLKFKRERAQRRSHKRYASQDFR